VSSNPLHKTQDALDSRIVNTEILEKVSQALRAGNDIDTAAHFAGISVSQMYRWLEVGKFEAERVASGQKADPANAQMLEFWEALRTARAEAIVRNVAYIQTAAKQGSWQAAAWWLERTVPETYSRTKPTQKVDEQKQISGD
jgi:hypothetical protein